MFTKRLQSSPHYFRPRLEPLETRIAPVLDYWVATGPDPLQTIAAWGVASNWSQNSVPQSTDDAIFDYSQFEYACTIPQGTSANAASVTFADNLPANTLTLTVNGGLQTEMLTLKARTAGSGAEVSIPAGGGIVVTRTMAFSGGDISGSVTSAITVTAAADTTSYVHVNGTDANDPPTLGVPLILGGPVGGGLGLGGGGEGEPGRVIMDWSGIAAQPLVVSANASITVNSDARIVFDNLPLQGDATATAVRNTDNATETIYVNAHGYVYSDGDYERVVEMGVRIYAGEQDDAYVVADAGDESAALHFTGQNIGGVGLVTTGGGVYVWGAMIFDKGATFNGGQSMVADDAELTLGEVGATVPTVMYGTTILKVQGMLVAHGGFNMSGGTLETDGFSGTINMDNGNTFVLSGGTIQLTNGTAVGSLTIHGNFTATAGTIRDTVDTSTGMFGTFEVNGDVNLDVMCEFFLRDSAVQSVDTPDAEWELFNWTGARTGTFSYSSPVGWTGSWDDTDKVFTLTEPS